MDDLRGTERFGETRDLKGVCAANRRPIKAGGSINSIFGRWEADDAITGSMLRRSTDREKKVEG